MSPPVPMKPGHGDVDTTKFDLKLGSNILYFDNPRCGWAYTAGKIFMKNPTKNRYTYKVKCTNNEMFDIKMPIGFIEPEESIDIEVLHCPGFMTPDNDVQHLAVYYIKCDKDAKEYSTIWRSKKPEGCKNVMIRFPRQIIMTASEKKVMDAKIKEEKQLKKSKEERKRKEEVELEKERIELAENEKKQKEEEEELKKKEEEEAKKKKKEKEEEEAKKK